MGLELIKPYNKSHSKHKEIYSPIQLTLHPPMKCGLEIDCMDGLKIKAGRLRGVNLWGCNYFEIEEAWQRNKVDPFIRIGTVYDIPYGDKLFDWISYDSGFMNVTKDDIEVALSEMKRVGTENVFIKVVPTEDRPVMWWINLYIRNQLYPEVVQVSSNDKLGCELRITEGF